MIDDKTLESIAIQQSTDRGLCKVYGHNWRIGERRAVNRPMQLGESYPTTTEGVVETKHWCRRCNIEVWK